jgi:formylmethanofuran dehydrogenase subunit E
MEYSEILNFHGHGCPGLAIGYRMSCAAMEALDVARSCDDEIIAIVENDACGIDALQCVTGCTFGKGNLIFHDYGKQVYTLYSRSALKGVRVVFHRDRIPSKLAEDRKALAEYILNAPCETFISLTEVAVDAPSPARIQKSVNCALCGEAVMETRLRTVNEQSTCIPCSESREKLHQAK